jgi:hypothetical protein
MGSPHMASPAVFLASFFPSSRLAFLPVPGKRALRRLRLGVVRSDSEGTQWVGRSHQSSQLGVIAHKLSWIRSVVSARGLRLEISSRRPLAGQIWAIVRRPGA